MEDSKSLDHHDEIRDENINKELLEINDKESESKFKIKNELHENSFHKGNFKTLADNKKEELTNKSKANSDNNNIDKSNNEIIKEKTLEDNKSVDAEPKSSTATNKSDGNVGKNNSTEIAKEKTLEDNKSVVTEAKLVTATNKSAGNVDKNNSTKISTSIPVKAKTKPLKQPPIEKKPFLEFVNDHLIPEIKNEFKLKGKEVNEINIQKTYRPIAEDICWVIYCEINDTCNFWLSFEKDDITSLKSFSLCKNYEKPSIIESFLIDEKKITLKLIISRILQRLNGQKLIGAN